jgi:hypothetical protein
MKNILAAIIVAVSGIVAYSLPAKADTVCYYDKQGQFYCHE